MKNACGDWGNGGVLGRSYRSSISESHTAVPALLPLPALPGAPSARLGARPGFGLGWLMLCPGNHPASQRGARAGEQSDGSAIAALSAAPSSRACSFLLAIRHVRNGVGPFSP